MDFLGDALLLVATRRRANPLIVPLIFLGGLAVLIYLAWWLRKFLNRFQRRKEMRRSFEVGVALRDQGMTQALSRSGSLVELLQPFELGQRGEKGSRMVRSLVESSAESDQLIWMMDYSYWASDGSRRRLWNQTVVLIERAECGSSTFSPFERDDVSVGGKTLQTAGHRFPRAPDIFQAVSVER